MDLISTFHLKTLNTSDPKIKDQKELINASKGTKKCLSDLCFGRARSPLCVPRSLPGLFIPDGQSGIVNHRK